MSSFVEQFGASVGRKPGSLVASKQGTAMGRTCASLQALPADEKIVTTCVYAPDHVP